MDIKNGTTEDRRNLINAIDILKNELSRCSNHYTKKAIKIKNSIDLLTNILNQI